MFANVFVLSGDLRCVRKLSLSLCLRPVPLHIVHCEKSRCSVQRASWPCTNLHGRGETNTTPTVVLLMIQWLRSMVFSLRGIDYSSGRSNTWSVEAMKTIAKYEKDCEPQRYCILYHMSNAYCALSPHNGNAYRSNSIGTLALTPEFSSESMLCCIACIESLFLSS